MKLKSSRGFTIVELLIVIVVIGILATITIVAFNGVQDRAQSAKTAAAVKAYETMLHTYSANNNGQYPYPRDINSRYAPNTEALCVGSASDFPADSAKGFNANECSVSVDGANRVVYASFSSTQNLATALAPYASSNSKFDIPYSEAIYTGAGVNGIYKERGIIYRNVFNGAGDVHTHLAYQIKGSSCAVSGHKRITYDSSRNTSYCMLILRVTNESAWSFFY